MNSLILDIITITKKYFFFSVVGGVPVTLAFSIISKKQQEIGELIKILLFNSYLVMVVLITLVDRRCWEEPYISIFGNFSLFYKDWGEWYLNTGTVENILLFVPFTILLLIGKRQNSRRKIWLSLMFCVSFSIWIEVCQGLFSKGTFQVSDIFYNSVGGLIGGGIVFLINRWIVLK